MDKPKSKISTNLLYRLNKDGEKIKHYHSLCDNKGPSLYLFLLKIGEIARFLSNELIDSISEWKLIPNVLFLIYVKK